MDAEDIASDTGFYVLFSPKENINRRSSLGLDIKPKKNTDPDDIDFEALYPPSLYPSKTIYDRMIKEQRR